MKQQFRLVTLLPKPKEIGMGIFSFEHDGTCSFFEGMAEHDALCLAQMRRARLELANSVGLRISGFESCGFDQQKREKFRYQEWGLTFARE